MEKIKKVECPSCKRIWDIRPIDSLIKKDCRCGEYLHKGLTNRYIFEKFYPEGYPKMIPDYCAMCEHWSQSHPYNPSKGTCQLYNEQTISGAKCIVTQFESSFGKIGDHQFGKQICPNCKEEQNITADYCKDCGSEMNPKEFVKIAHCDKCETTYPTDFTFCETDGNKLKIKNIEKDTNNQASGTQSKKKIIEKSFAPGINQKASIQEIPKWMEKKEEIYKKPEEEVDIEKDKGELGFGFGNFWIGMGFFQGFLVLIFFVILGNETDDIPNAAVGLIMSTLAIGSAYGIMKRKLYGLYMVYASIILYGLGGLNYLTSYYDLDKIKGIAAIFVGVLWLIYFNKRKEMFS